MEEVPEWVEECRSGKQIEQICGQRERLKMEIWGHGTVDAGDKIQDEMWEEVTEVGRKGKIIGGKEID